MHMHTYTYVYMHVSDPAYACGARAFICLGVQPWQVYLLIHMGWIGRLLQIIGLFGRISSL